MSRQIALKARMDAAPALAASSAQPSVQFLVAPVGGTSIID